MKKLKRLAIFLLALAVMIPVSANAATATEAFGGKYTRGITRISWWMSYDNNGGWYEYQIINAVNNWQNPGWSNPITFVAASSNAGTMMDIYSQPKTFWATSLQDSVLAETRFYNSSGSQINPTSDYYFTRIYLNDGTMHNLSVDPMRGTITHEIGHTLGLKHNNTNVNSIMCQTAYGRAVQTVQQIDNTAVVNLYQ